MIIAIAALAAIGCSLCNGISTVQQKIGADQQGKVKRFDLTFLVRVYKNVPYLLGTFLELAGYGLSLIALRVLPLFLVQSVIAASVIVTAFGERLFLGRRLDMQTYLSLTAIILGLALLSSGAVTGHATLGSHDARLVIELLPIPLTVLGLAFIYIGDAISSVALAALGGLAFGNTSTIGRILVYPHNLSKLIENPMLYSLIASAILGQYLFTVSLQRSTATRSNAVMITMQTLGPAICGLLFFDDKIRSGFQALVLVGGFLVILGSAATAVDVSPAATI